MDIKRRLFLRGRPMADASAVSRPPWSVVPDAEFIARCTRCGDCVRNCPRKVLKPGDGGFPVINFDQAGCSLCGECARVCKTTAIAPAEQSEPFHWRVKVSGTCLTRHGVECRVCGDSCDSRALRFVPAHGGIAQLQIDLDCCTGCGDCVGTCPVKAISLG